MSTSPYSGKSYGSAKTTTSTKVAVPAYGSPVKDSSGKQVGIAAYNPNTGAPLERSGSYNTSNNTPTVYTPSASATPTFGTNSNANLELQKYLNSKGANLVLDAKYGPKTQAAYALYGSGYGKTNTQDTVQDATKYNNAVIGDIFTPDYSSDPTYQRTQSILRDQVRGVDSVDPSAIRSQKIAEMQDRINALNQVYDQQLKRATGRNTAMLANTGLTGSPRGNAIVTGVENEVDLNRNIGLQALYKEATDYANAEAQRRRESIQSGAKSYIENLKGQDERKQSALTSYAQSFIQTGIDPRTIPLENLQTIASKLGVSKENIIAAYDQAKYTANQEALKLNKPVELNQGSKYIVYDPVTKSYKEVANNPKTTGTGGGSLVKSGSAVFSSSQISQFSKQLEESKGSDGYVNPGTYQQAFEAWTDPKVGGLAKDFLLKYPPKKYVNPANNTLPAYLRSGTVKAGGGRSI